MSTDACVAADVLTESQICRAQYGLVRRKRPWSLACKSSDGCFALVVSVTSSANMFTHLAAAIEIVWLTLHKLAQQIALLERGRAGLVVT